MEMLVDRVPKVVGHYEFVGGENEPPTHIFFDLLPEQLPREFMDELQGVRGDASNRISFSSDLSSKDFGSGFAAGCTVSIVTGADGTTFGRAADLASRWSLYFAKMHFERAEAEFRQLMLARGKAVT